MQVVIVGGSLSGLIHAIIFKSLGYDVHVLEKSSVDRLRSQAAGLSAGADVQRFLSEYIKPKDPYAKQSGSVEIVNLEGGVVNAIPSKDPYHLTTWSLLYNLLKTHLLEDEAHLAKYETDKWVREVKPNDHNITVVYSDVKSEALNELRADLVIAADGAHSAIRETVITKLIEKTTDPFVSAIRECSTPKSVFYDGKLLLVGDAFSLFRPHIGASTNQAARQALELAEVFRGQKSLKEWEESSLSYAKMTSTISTTFGNYCFTGKVPQSLSTAIKPDQQAE